MSADAANPIVSPGAWDTSSWKPYENKKFHFALSLPPSYEVKELPDAVEIKDTREGHFNSLRFVATKNTVAGEVGKHFGIGTKIGWETLNHSEVWAIKINQFTADAYSKMQTYILFQATTTVPEVPTGVQDMLIVTAESSAPFRDVEPFNDATAMGEPEYSILTTFHFTK